MAPLATRTPLARRKRSACLQAYAHYFVARETSPTGGGVEPAAAAASTSAAAAPAATPTVGGAAPPLAFRSVAAGAAVTYDQVALALGDGALQAMAGYKINDDTKLATVNFALVVTMKTEPSVDACAGEGAVAAAPADAQAAAAPTGKKPRKSIKPPAPRGELAAHVLCSDYQHLLIPAAVRAPRCAVRTACAREHVHAWSATSTGRRCDSETEDCATHTQTLSPDVREENLRYIVTIGGEAWVINPNASMLLMRAILAAGAWQPCVPATLVLSSALHVCIGPTPAHVPQHVQRTRRCLEENRAINVTLCRYAVRSSLRGQRRTCCRGAPVPTVWPGSRLNLLGLQVAAARFRCELPQVGNGVLACKGGHALVALGGSGASKMSQASATALLLRLTEPVGKPVVPSVSTDKYECLVGRHTVVQNVPPLLRAQKAAGKKFALYLTDGARHLQNVQLRGATAPTARADATVHSDVQAQCSGWWAHARCTTSRLRRNTPRPQVLGQQRPAWCSRAPHRVQSQAHRRRQQQRPPPRANGARRRRTKCWACMRASGAQAACEDVWCMPARPSTARGRDLRSCE